MLDLSSRQNMNSFAVPLKRHELADYLNIQRPSLSREMARMRDDGLIEFKGSAVTIKNRSALEKSVRK